MFRWFFRWREKRRRQIFRFFDGNRMRQCDPIETLLKIQSDPAFNPDLHMPLVDEGDCDAIRITCNAVRNAFDVAEFDPATGKGLTIAERLALLEQFSVYIESLKKSTDSSATRRSPMAPMSNESDGPTTNDTSDIGPTSSEPNSEKQAGCASP